MVGKMCPAPWMQLQHQAKLEFEEIQQQFAPMNWEEQEPVVKKEQLLCLDIDDNEEGDAKKWKSKILGAAKVI